MKLFVDGRSKVFDELKGLQLASHKIIWFHCASLGEYEQGVPVMQLLKKQYTDYKILVTFFSPSGYEAKKRSALADHITYMPLDTPKNVSCFLNYVQPAIAIFVKYEFWPNFISGLHKRNIPLLIISASFRRDQAIFKTYGKFLRNKLALVNHFFVQDEHSIQLLKSIHFSNVTLSGDTRFDRVSQQIAMDNTIDFIDHFINNRKCIVIGSSWSEDEDVFVKFINNSDNSTCFIIAPHEIKTENIKSLRSKITKEIVLFSNRNTYPIHEKSYPQVCIVDSIGILSKLYSYADVAYVGGAMGTTGLHNILEPATFGVPILIGKNFEKFREAKQLQKLAGLFSIATSQEFEDAMNKLLKDKSYREKTGMIAEHFVNSNTGATVIISQYIASNKLLNTDK
ncbi:3-deoxy-D-manno-octulosonic acid transferase [Aquimarina sp. W85]|uniref:3-deoxy-D-manno-octulosonic acid transferase n=1 Tax=Aquimarina rhodophyticola TaxID=3342246 RepID=UPI00366F42B1